MVGLIWAEWSLCCIARGLSQVEQLPWALSLGRAMVSLCSGWMRDRSSFNLWELHVHPGSSHAAFATAEQQRLRKLCWQPARALPIPQPACAGRASSPGAAACLFLRQWLVLGGVTCVPCSLESSQCSQPPSFPSGASLYWAVLDASGALLLLSQSCSAPAELARLSHISSAGKAGSELDSVYKTTEINTNTMAQEQGWNCAFERQK